MHFALRERSIPGVREAKQAVCAFPVAGIDPIPDLLPAGPETGLNEQPEPPIQRSPRMKPPAVLNPILSALGTIPALALAAALALPQPAAADPAKASLTLTVTGIKDVKGALMVAVFDQAGYDTDKAVAATMIPVSGASVTTTISLPAGKYGIKLFHDVDGDGKMGTNPFGMPIEPYAFSNDAPAQFGPAKWDAAAFEIGAPATSHTIKLN
jgi:uncharacterized protein (DUF2141 family)